MSHPLHTTAIICVIAACLTTHGTHASTSIVTSFSNADGFITGASSPVTIGTPRFQVTFTGFQQQQGFDRPSYAEGPEALLGLNSTFTGTSGRTISNISTISFSSPASLVTLFAASRAGGAPILRIIGSDLSVLGSIPIISTSNRITEGAFPIFLDANNLGGAISRIEIDNLGPSGTTSVTAIDLFAAEAAIGFDPVPEPSTGILGLLSLSLLLRRKRS